MNPVKIRVYIDSRGKNVILDWLQDLPAEARAKIHNRLRYMQSIEKAKWIRPFAAKIRGKPHDNIIEVRIQSYGCQYRPLGFWGPNVNEFTLLVGAIEKGSKFEPKSAPDIASRRRLEVISGEACTNDYFPNDK